MNVSCDFLGRLGNNLFQTAAMIGYTTKHGGTWAIPKGYKYRQIYDYFPQLPMERNSTGIKYAVWKEPDFSFTEIPKHKNDNLRLHGFFQSVKYFEHCQDEVRSLIKLQEEPIEYVGLHWRRGDYLQYADRFPTITEKYLTQAIDFMVFKGYKDFLVFSDDIEYCKTYLPARFPYVNFKYSEGRNEYDDLSLMASCEHNIISNSSFSWMAAWFNRNKNKIVISPSKETWFGDNNKLDTKDLIPKEWIQFHAR